MKVIAASVSAFLLGSIPGALSAEPSLRGGVALSTDFEDQAADLIDFVTKGAAKNKEAQEKLWYWTEVEGCEECKKYDEEMKKATSKLGKKEAKKYYLEAAAASLRAASHLSDDAKEDWNVFQEKFGASKAERLADKWLERHASSYDEMTLADVGFGRKASKIQSWIARCKKYADPYDWDEDEEEIDFYSSGDLFDFEEDYDSDEDSEDYDWDEDYDSEENFVGGIFGGKIHRCMKKPVKNCDDNGKCKIVIKKICW